MNPTAPTDKLAVPIAIGDTVAFDVVHRKSSRLRIGEVVDFLPYGQIKVRYAVSATKASRTIIRTGTDVVVTRGAM